MENGGNRNIADAGVPDDVGDEIEDHGALVRVERLSKAWRKRGRGLRRAGGPSGAATITKGTEMVKMLVNAIPFSPGVLQEERRVVKNTETARRCPLTYGNSSTQLRKEANHESAEQCQNHGTTRDTTDLVNKLSQVVQPLL